MLPTSRILRLSSTSYGQDARYLQLARTAIIRARHMLADYPRPDTFVGRKTQEPFPSEHSLDSNSNPALS
jgi:hypothetical protein